MANSPREINNSPASAELVKSILANQSRELELRKQVEDNRKQSLKYNYELAKQSLQAQAEDRKAQRTHQKILWKWLLIFSGLMVCVIFAFMCFALYLGKEAFLWELIKIIFYGGSGFLAGTKIDKMKRQKPDETQE